MKTLSYLEACILKSSGAKIDVKVTIEISPEKDVFIHMRDFTFFDYRSAAKFLRYVVETELVPTATFQGAVAS